MKIVNLPKELLLLMWEYFLSDTERRWHYSNNEHEQNWIQFTATSRSFQSLRRESVYFKLNTECCVEYLREVRFRERVSRSVNNIYKQIAINLYDFRLENDDISILSGVNYLCLDLCDLPKSFSLENIYCFSLWASFPFKLSNFRNISVLNISSVKTIDFSQLPLSVKSLTIGHISTLFPLSPNFPFGQLDELSIADDRVTDGVLHYFSSTVKKLDLSSEAISDFSTTTFPLLKDLSLTQCHQVKSISSCLTQLESLRVVKCYAFSLGLSFKNFPFLTFLCLEFCSKIKEINFLQFPSLREVLINGCDGITSLIVENPPSNDSLQSLYKMNIRSCSALSELRFDRNIGYLTVEDCFSLTRITVSDPFRVYSLKINNGKNRLVKKHLSQEEYQFPSISGRVNFQQLMWENRHEEIQYGIYP
jgi:hypothetical protein